MSLRRQLMLVCLLLLSLPWAGCQYLRVMEDTLQQGQTMAVKATANAIGAALSEREDLLFPMGSARLSQSVSTSWAIPEAAPGLVSDGYATDWMEQTQLEALAGTPAGVSIRAASRDDRLFVLVEVRDDTLRYATPARLGDHLQLRCIDAIGSTARYTLSAEAPGRLDLRSASGVVDSLARASRGAWRETGSGYRVEFQMPLDSRCQRLSLIIVDAAESDERVRFDSRRLFADTTPWLVYHNADLQVWLQAFSQAGRYIQVSDPFGLSVADAFGAAASRSAETDEVFWVLQWLYRLILRDDAARQSTGNQEVALRLGLDTNQQLLQAGTDMEKDSRSLGTVTVSESTERYMALTDKATSRLFAISALIVLGAFTALLVYASILSWRIRRLSVAAEAVSHGDISPEDFPQSAARDELGELSRRYADLLKQIDAYNRYLRGLARSLAHELRTPIAVVGSSLENLAQQDLDAAARQTYRLRAQEGIQRLEKLVASMTEASRIEDSLLDAARSPLLIDEFLNGLTRAYRDAYPEHRFSCSVPEHSVSIVANDELLAQALDKLVSNATSFTAEGETIQLTLREEPTHIAIEVTNPGPPLPDTLRDRLFEPMVSVRPQERGTETHLGLGLHIARSIAQAHDGDLLAANLPEEQGVVFTLRLPCNTTA
ncbi:MAG: proteobacterial dedicated sortase system histidine kinase [Congregibacter sp.]